MRRGAAWGRCEEVGRAGGCHDDGLARVRACGSRGGGGDVVGVWGAGAIGLSIARLSKLRGASKVFVVDKDAQRLALAESFGMVPVDVNQHKDVAEYILSVQPGGLDRGIEASAFRSADSVQHKIMRATGLERDSGDTPTSVLRSVRKCGNVALIGDFFFETNQFPIGLLMEKTITLRGGQLMAQRVSLNMFACWGD